MLFHISRVRIGKHPIVSPLFSYVRCPMRPYALFALYKIVRRHIRRPPHATLSQPFGSVSNAGGSVSRIYRKVGEGGKSPRSRDEGKGSLDAQVHQGTCVTLDHSAI